jgi:hypothetical protein
VSGRYHNRYSSIGTHLLISSYTVMGPVGPSAVLRVAHAVLLTLKKLVEIVNDTLP